MLTVKHIWDSTGSSGGFPTLHVHDPASLNRMHIACSTLTTTQSISFQSAIDSSGPWFVEGSTQIAVNTSTSFVLQVNGPVGPYVRPYLHSAATGTYRVMLLGVE